MNRSSVRIALLAVTSLACAVTHPIQARAQAADTAAAPADTVFRLESMVVTATRVAAPGQALAASALGHAVTLVDLGLAASPYALEALRDVPGSFMDESVGPGGPTIVRLRAGEEVFTQILIDGVQVNQNGGFFDFQGLALSNLDRMEVARGPQSAVYGSSAVSGVVHLLTPRGPEGPPRVTLKGEGGSAVEEGGSWRLSGAVRGGTPRFRYSLGGGAAYSRGIYDLPHDTRTADGSLRLDWAPAPSWDATVTARRINVESLLPVRDAGATRVPLDPNAFNERTRDVEALTVRFAPSSSWNAYVRMSRYNEDFLYADEFDDVSVPPDAGYFVFDANLVFESALTRTTAEAAVAAAAGPVRATVGLVTEREELLDRISGDFASDPLGLERSSVAGFGEVAWTPTADLVVGAGVRLEDYEGLPIETTPRASLRWTHADAPVSLRMVVGRAYKAPNLQQQYVDNPFIASNPDLRPERSTSVEAGVDLGGRGRPWSAGLTVFRQSFDDLIRTVAQEGEEQQINRNLGESRATGVEWEAGVRLSGPWRIETQGAWIETEILENSGLATSEFPVGESLPFRPSFVGSVTLAYQGAGPLSGRLTAGRRGSQTVLAERFSGPRTPLDGYTLVWASASWRAQDRVRVFARVGNLLDTEYRTAFDRMGSPATGALGMEVVF